MSSTLPEEPPDQDPFTPDALSNINKPSISDGFGEVKEGASKFAHGLILVIIGIIAYLAASNDNEKDEDSFNVSFLETSQGWVARDQDLDLRSVAMPTKEEALLDLEENIKLHTGELTISDETIEAIEDSENDLDNDNTVSLDDISTDSQPS